mgnify:CR=1 FL=1|jgi:orotate phosphoribosyltransferase
MKNVDNLIESATELAGRGLSRGEIADELNVSRETASWLVERGGVESEPDQQPRTPTGPQDIHVDWSAIGRDSQRLTHISHAMADLISKDETDVGLTVGIEKAGVPLATVVANKLDTDIAAYGPAKHQWEEGDINDFDGGFSQNFAAVSDQNCYIIDDIITSGTTMQETITAVRDCGGTPVGCVVLVDKQGVEEIDGVPVLSLMNVVSVAPEE